MHINIIRVLLGDGHATQVLRQLVRHKVFLVNIIQTRARIVSRLIMVHYSNVGNIGNVGHVVYVHRRIVHQYVVGGQRRSRLAVVHV